MGVLHALEENNCLRVKSCSGSSAGALVAAFLASGMKPNDMPSEVFPIRREDIWDLGIGLGLLKGDLFQRLLEDKFPVKTIEECSIPLGVTAYDVLGFRTNCITKGDLATAVRASCTFPGLFQPVVIDDRYVLICAIMIRDIAVVMCVIHSISSCALESKFLSSPRLNSTSFNH